MAGLCGELDSAVALPGSDAPSGICTVSRGPLGLVPPTAPLTLRLFALEGGVKASSALDDTDAFRVLSRLLCVPSRFGGGDDVSPLRSPEASTDCDLFVDSPDPASDLMECSILMACGSEAKEARC